MDSKHVLPSGQTSNNGVEESHGHRSGSSKCYKDLRDVKPLSREDLLNQQIPPYNSSLKCFEYLQNLPINYASDQSPSSCDPVPVAVPAEGLTKESSASITRQSPSKCSPPKSQIEESKDHSIPRSMIPAFFIDFKEDVIDGFAIISFKSVEHLKVYEEAHPVKKAPPSAVDANSGGDCGSDDGSQQQQLQQLSSSAPGASRKRKRASAVAATASVVAAAAAADENDEDENEDDFAVAAAASESLTVAVGNRSSSFAEDDATGGGNNASDDTVRATTESAIGVKCADDASAAATGPQPQQQQHLPVSPNKSAYKPKTHLHLMHQAATEAGSRHQQLPPSLPMPAQSPHAPLRVSVGDPPRLTSPLGPPRHHHLPRLPSPGLSPSERAPPPPLSQRFPALPPLMMPPPPPLLPSAINGGPVGPPLAFPKPTVPHGYTVVNY